jgi:hypothetical protein
MRVAVLSESPADEAAIRIILNSVLGVETRPVTSPPLRSRGWPSVLRVLPTVMKHLHYQTDADALVVVVDSDDSPVHRAEHESPGGEEGRCRLCQLRHTARIESGRLRPVPGREAIRTAVGLAVPAVEAWYLCGVDARVNEATWVGGLQEGRTAYTRSELKEAVYGTDRPSIQIETLRAVEAAKRLANNLDELQLLFPNGFGAFARDVKSWS